MFVSAEIGRVFGVELIHSSKMENALQKWDDISSGYPPWLSAEDGIETVNMAKHMLGKPDIQQAIWILSFRKSAKTLSSTMAFSKLTIRAVI